MWFLACVPPAWLRDNLSTDQLRIIDQESLWLTLGVFNIIVLCRDSDLDTDLQNLCYKHSIAFERWNIQQTLSRFEYEGNIVDYDNPETHILIDKSGNTELHARAYREANIHEDGVISFLQLELYALLAVVENRAIGPYKHLALDCFEIEKIANRLIQDIEEEGSNGTQNNSSVKINGSNRAEVLLTLNAALSRLSSQAFSGTSPILRTESHFWPHSFLGIGVANLALRNLSRFITRTIEETKYHERIDNLKSKRFSIEDFRTQENKTRKFPSYLSIDNGQICHSRNADTILPDDIELTESTDQRSPNPITYYSGRDGFMNGALTTSAPLPSVSGGNSYQWNLGTITHELSHRILSGDIVQIFERFLKKILKIQKSNGTVWEYFDRFPETYSELAEKLIAYSVLVLHARDFEQSELRAAFEERPLDFFLSAREQYSEEIEEMLVHIFDFYHFYESDPKLYCDFVWLSWAVQPSIQKNLDNYIRRTITALSVRHLRSENWVELAFADFESVLNLEPLKSKLKFRDEVLKRISKHDSRSDLETYLEIMEYVLATFHLFFKLDLLQSRASTDPHKSPVIRYRKGSNSSKERRRYNYKITPLTFVSENPAVARPKFSNPLLFIRDHSREDQPNAGHTAWLLHMLAFNWDDPDFEVGRST